MMYARPDNKHPVQMVQFRMAVENVLTKFIESPDESIEFPNNLNREKRKFVQEMCYKLGLKSQTKGKDKNSYVVAYKKETLIVTESSPELQLRTTSKKIIIKMIESFGGVDNLQDDEQVPINTETNKGKVHKHMIGSIRAPAHANPTKSFIQEREKLPIFKHRAAILDLIKKNQIIVVQCATGSGKSTQIPQYLLEESSEKNLPCRIIVAEPRRICATNLAGRVSAERGETIGSVVGYQVRLESKVAPTSNLIFVTNGVILRMLLSENPREFLNSITALIIDEVHERDKFSDFVLLCIKHFVHLNPNLKVIIMSATIQSDIFSKYFPGSAVLQLEGQSYEVEEVYLEDILKQMKFSNSHVQTLKEKFAKNPQQFEKQEISIKDDTLETANDILEKISLSNDCDKSFQQFFYIVQAENAPVDFRHSKTNKTALMFAVEYQFEAHVLKLLSLKADPKLTILTNDENISAVDIALSLKNESIHDILSRSMEVLNEPVAAGNTGNVTGSSLYDRQLLDIYYDTLVQPGVNRGIFLEDVVDLNLIVRLVRHLHFNTDPQNGILIFLPGHDDIIQLSNLLFNALDMNYEIFILHSQLQTTDQIRVFDKMSEGIRKIVIATNIAESSVTVNDIVYVIDSGKEKRAEYDAATHVSSLRPQWISQASAKQRKGRAGRVQNGVVFRIYSRDRFAFLEESPKPEFLRSDLTDICLQAKLIGGTSDSIHEFLSKAITPASDRTITQSIKLLEQMGALNATQELTLLGRFLADIPISVKYGKMLFYGTIFKCIDPILTIVSILTTNDPFVLSFNDNDRIKCQLLKRKLEDGSYSDHFVMLKIYQKWNEYKTKHDFDNVFAEDHFVSSATLERIAATRLKIIAYLRSVRLIQSVGNISSFNVNSNSWPTIKACIAAGSYPEVARILKQRCEIKTTVDQNILINTRSVIALSQNNKMTKHHFSTFPTNWMIFNEKNLCGTKAFAKVCTLVSEICVVLTCGSDVKIREKKLSDNGEPDREAPVEIIVDGLIQFTVAREVAISLQDIRTRLNSLIGRTLENMEKFHASENDRMLIEGIVKLLELEDEKCGFKTKHEGIGQRPRVVTREFNSTKKCSHTEDKKTQEKNKKPSQTKSKEQSPAVPKKQSPPVRVYVTTYRGDQIVDDERKENVSPPSVNQPPAPTYMNNIRYFTVELASNELLGFLKGKTIVHMSSEAKLPSSALDAFQQIQLNDRVTKKVFIFYCGKQVVGSGLLMVNCDIQMAPENMKMFFQSNVCFEISDLRSCSAEYENFFQHPFVELPYQIGYYCVKKCLAVN